MKWLKLNNGMEYIRMDHVKGFTIELELLNPDDPPSDGDGEWVITANRTDRKEGTTIRRGIKSFEEADMIVDRIIGFIPLEGADAVIDVNDLL